MLIEVPPIAAQTNNQQAPYVAQFMKPQDNVLRHINGIISQVLMTPEAPLACAAKDCSGNPFLLTCNTPTIS